jgi:hypothetical protein
VAPESDCESGTRRRVSSPRSTKQTNCIEIHVTSTSISGARTRAGCRAAVDLTALRLKRTFHDALRVG